MWVDRLHDKPRCISCKSTYPFAESYMSEWLDKRRLEHQEQDQRRHDRKLKRINKGDEYASVPQGPPPQNKQRAIALSLRAKEGTSKSASKSRGHKDPPASEARIPRLSEGDGTNVYAEQSQLLLKVEYMCQTKAVEVTQATVAGDQAMNMSGSLAIQAADGFP